MTMSDRGVHPDLLEEVLAEREAASAPAQEVQNTGGRSARRRSSPPAPTEDATTVPAGETEPASTSVSPDQGDQPAPESADQSWFDQVREAKDPTEALRLLAKNMPIHEELQRDQELSGWMGGFVEKRARELLAKQQRDEVERRKLEAAQNNDLYTLGELTQRELQAPLQAQQQAEQAAPFMDGVVAFQKTLPEAIQREVSGQVFGAGKSYAEGVAEYMAFVVDRAAKLERSKIESAVRKSVMSELNGDEPVPERDSGTPGRVREVTDEQIANMSLSEYNALFDESGRPKPGVRHRPTRGIPIRNA